MRCQCPVSAARNAVVVSGLRARLCDDVDALNSYLPPHVTELARKIAGVLEVPQPITA